MNLSKVATILGLFASTLRDCLGDSGKLHFTPHLVADAGGRPDEPHYNVSNNVNLRLVTDDIRKLRRISNGLRGGAHPSDIVEDVQQIMQSQLESVQHMQKMQQDNDGQGLLHIFKSVIGDGTAFNENSNDFTNKGDLSFLSKDDDLDAISKLEEVPDSQIAQLLAPKHFDDILLQLQDAITILGDIKSIFRPSDADQRHLNANFFSDESKNDGYYQFSEAPFEFEANGNSGHGPFYASKSSPWQVNAHELVKKAFYQARGVRRNHFPGISEFIHAGDDAHSVNERHKITKKHERRLEALGVCKQQKCPPSDTNCNCNKLLGCINDMSDYDIALLFVGDLIDIDPSSDKFATFPEHLYLFDADFKIVSKINRIRELASRNNCSLLLPELHSACNPLLGSCSGSTSHSFQLSIDDVCGAVNRPTKLLLTSISDELDGYWGDNGLESRVTSCGVERLALRSCQSFAFEFDLLYNGRDEAIYPDWNPMRQNPLLPVQSADFIRFPTEYKFKQSVHGLDTLSSMYDVVRVMSNMEKCIEASSDNKVYLANCAAGSPNQGFYYEPSTHRIKIKRNGYCLNYNPSNRNVYMRVCHFASSQKWYYDTLTQGLKTYVDNNCLDWSTGNPVMNTKCNGNTSQKFVIPSRWLPAISMNRVQVFSNASQCIDVNQLNSRLLLVVCNQTTTSQEFEYDSLTRQIKQGQQCMDCSRSAPYYVYMNDCHSGNNQKWFLDTSTNRLRTAENNMCVNWDGIKVHMTSCDNRLTEKFQLPQHWLEGIGTSSFDELRLFSDLSSCVTLKGSSVIMSTCDATNINQRLYFNSRTLEITFQDGKCLDYNFNNFDVYANGCHGGRNQKWFYYRTKNFLKSLPTDKCVSLINGELVTDFCDGRDSQKFLIPNAWSAARLSAVKSIRYPDTCMVYNPDQNNNVRMTNCDKDVGLGNYFQFDPFTREIKVDGLCLGIVSGLFMDTAKGNVVMSACNGGSDQKWSYDSTSSQIRSENNNCIASPPVKCCLNLESDGNVMAKYCNSTEQIQKFIVPESWTKLDFSSDMNYPFYSRPVSPAVWSSNTCLVSTLKDTIQTCDASMSLLLGNSTSLGTLRSIAELVNEKGPDRMPGSCCLDSPLTSQFFGYHYNPAISKCQNPGPWHLGITKEACERALGRWFRSPCVTLKECIDARPKNTTEHYSQSFEEFAKKFQILDPSQEKQCQEVREKLGFEADYPFDTEVCQAFESYMCDEYFTTMDTAKESLKTPKFEEIKYEKVRYPPDLPLTFEKLPERLEGSAFQPFQQPELGKFSGLNTLFKGMIVAKYAKFVVDETIDSLKALNPCDGFPTTCFIDLKAICHKVYQVIYAIKYAIKISLSIAYEVVSTEYEKATLGPSDVMDMFTQIQYSFNNMKAFDSWNTKALDIVNKNMLYQHTEMRASLQERHETLENNINNFVKEAVNGLGKQLEEAHNNLETKVDTLSKTCIRQNATVNRALKLSRISVAGKGPKISCGFNLSHSSIGTMEMIQGNITTIFVREDVSSPTVAIPLFLVVEDNSDSDLSVQVTVRSNSAIVSDKKTVALLYKSSLRQIVPFLLPQTCSTLNAHVCDQSGEDFVLYEFSFVAVNQMGTWNDPAICNVIVHDTTGPFTVRSNVRYDLLPRASFP